MLGGLRHADDIVAQAQFRVGKPGFLASEHNSHAMFVGKLGDFRGGLSRFDDLRKLRAAFAVRRADQPMQAVGRFLPRRHRAGFLQHIARAVART